MSHAPKVATESRKGEGVGGQLGRQIVRIRNGKGMTQKELADHIGVTESRLCRWEKGCHLPSLPQLLAIAQALDTGLDELVFGRNPGAMPSWQRERLAEGLRTLIRLLGTEEVRRPAPSVQSRGSK